jgi:hypothetical protein
MTVKRSFNFSMMVLAWAMVSLGLSGCSNGPDPEPPDIGTSAQAFSTTGAVLTYHNDNARTGQNLTETTLTYASVQQQYFGKLSTLAVDDNVYAQPLYVPGLSIAGGVHNTLYVATESNSIYAFDADTGAQLAHWSFGAPVPSISLLPSCGCQNIVPNVGITGTPVIDATTSTLYFVTYVASGSTFTHYINAIDIVSGAHKFGSPATVSASVAGDGPEAVGGHISFNSARALQRPGLLLQGGRVYVAWGSHCDDGIHFPQEWFHGWTMSFSAANVAAAPVVLNTTPHADTAHPSCTAAACGTACAQTTCNAGCCPTYCSPGQCTANCVVAPYGGAIWQGGSGLASDGSFVYGNTGNGLYDPVNADYGDSTLAFNLSTLAVSSHFTPADQSTLRLNDWDLAAGGVVLPPDGINTQYPHLLVTADKTGTIYLLNRDALGGAALATNANAVGTGQDDQYFGVPAAFQNGSTASLYFGGHCDHMKAFSLGNTSPPLGVTPAVKSTDPVYPYPGVVPTVSANGTSNAIVWAARRAYNNLSCSGVSPSTTSALLAYRADTLAVLYDSSKVANDSPGTIPQFSTPTVAGGKVFVPGHQTVAVYGILPGCNAITCPSGCCQSGTCVSPPTNAACGTGGAACAACASTYTCVNGACKAPAYAGYLDSANCSLVGGWAWDGNQPNTPINVDISVDGVVKGTVSANLFRQDLLNAGIGNGYHGFQWTLPAAYDDGAAHSVSATISGTSQALGTSPKSVTCGCGPANCANGCCQNGTCITATGNSACGTGGAACQTCASNAACVNNACVTCSPATCPNGCCQNGACVTGISDSSCGTGGAACQACPSGQGCVNHACVTCGSFNCASGCCQNGTCVAGTSTSACGTGGAACQTCQSGATCTNNACVGPGPACGTNYCGSGQFCCNSSCGICAPFGGNCTQQYCPPSQ